MRTCACVLSWREIRTLTTTSKNTLGTTLLGLRTFINYLLNNQKYVRKLSRKGKGTHENTKTKITETSRLVKV